MSAHPAQISVTVPVGQAIDHVKRVLFVPFNPGKWFTIGFCAWLASLGAGGFGNSFNYSGRRRGGLNGARHVLDQVRDFVSSNLYWLLPLAIGAAAMLLVLWLVMIWLSSRGRFMFLHCVALDKAEVAVPWQRFAREGNSLFGFRLVVGLLGLVPLLVVGVLLGILLYRAVTSGEAGAASWLSMIGLVLALVVLAIFFGIVGKFTTDFVVPIMFLRGGNCLAAWGMLLNLLSANLGRFVLYLLFQIVLGLAIGALVLAVILVTCCVAGCLLIIPYLGTVLLLPILVFSRAYSIYYLAQYGSDYDVLPPAIAAPT